MIFPGTSGATEATNTTFWAVWDPNAADSYSKAISISGDGSALTDNTDTYQVMGSNEGPTGYADAVPVADDAGSSAARAFGGATPVGFTKNNWPYKYIGIKFAKGGGGTHTGTFTFYFNSAATKVALV